MEDLKLNVKLEGKTATPQGLVVLLLGSVLQAHIFHLQTESYAQHMALGSYYEQMQGLTDKLVETYQGKYGIIKGYAGGVPVTDLSDCCAYFKTLHAKVTGMRGVFKDSDLVNIFDEVTALLKTTIYKLEYLH